MIRTKRWPSPRITRDIFGYTLIDGMTFLGRVRTPPLPVHIIMTDRANNQRFALSHTGQPGNLTLDLVTPANWPDIAEFMPYDGPYTGDWRLFIQNGSLNAERTTKQQNNLRVFTRKNFDRTFLEITVSKTGVLVFTQTTV